MGLFILFWGKYKETLWFCSVILVLEYKIQRDFSIQYRSHSFISGLRYLYVQYFPFLLFVLYF